MSIRPATLDDLPAIVAMGEIFHNESPRWRRLRFSRARAAHTFAHLITNPNGLVLLATKCDAIVGGIAASCSMHWCSEDLLVDEICLFVMPEHRGGLLAARLIFAMRAWSKSKNALWNTAGTSTGIDPEVTARLYEHAGFVRCSIGLEAYFGN